MVAKTVSTMFLTAMPDLDFKDQKWHDLTGDLPSSTPYSPITVEVSAPIPFNL